MKLKNFNMFINEVRESKEDDKNIKRSFSTIEFDSKKEAKKIITLMKNTKQYHDFKIDKTLNNKYVVLFNKDNS